MPKYTISDYIGKKVRRISFLVKRADDGKYHHLFSIVEYLYPEMQTCQRDRSVASAYQTALKKKDDIAIALALSPFARKTAELVNSGAYEAAGSCYAIFRCLAKTCKENEDWFAGFTGYGDIYTKLAIFTEAVVELYCHLRQKNGLSKRMADEMDINLEVFNLETDFFGDLHCSSRFTDMLCDAQAQYGDYSELEKCPMWGMWEKEGGEITQWGKW